MSGPIVRKYGFPNFEKIFGDRGLKHGSDAEPETPKHSDAPSEPAKSTTDPEPVKPESGTNRP